MTQEEAVEKLNQGGSMIIRIVDPLYGVLFIGSLCWLTVFPSLTAFLIWAATLVLGVTVWRIGLDPSGHENN